MADGFVIRVKSTKDGGKPFQVMYLMSYGRNGSLKGGSHREMGIIYKQERLVKRIVRELNEKPFYKAAALPSECPKCFSGDLTDTCDGWMCDCCNESGTVIYEQEETDAIK